MKIQFIEEGFFDYSRVGYDTVFISYKIVEDDDPKGEFKVPEGYTREEATSLASDMAHAVYHEHISYAEAYNRYVKKK